MFNAGHVQIPHHGPAIEEGIGRPRVEQANHGKAPADGYDFRAAHVHLAPVAQV